MVSSVLKTVKKPIFKVLASITIIIVLLWIIPLSELLDTLKNVSITVWLIVLGGFLIGHLLGAVKWRLLVNIEEELLPFLVAVQCYFAGLFSNLFLPSLAGGDVIKAGLAIHHNKKKSITIFATFLDRIIDTCSIVFLIFVSAFFSPEFLQPSHQRVVYIILGLFLLLFLSALMFLFLPHDWVNKTSIRRVLLKAKNTIKLAFNNPVKLIVAFGLSLIIQSCFILLTIYLAIICEIEIPIVMWFLIWPLAKLFALLPISLGGIGVREAALAALLSRLSIPVSNSVALGLLWNSILISGGLLGGVIYFGLKKYLSENSISLLSFAKDYKKISDSDQ